MTSFAAERVLVTGSGGVLGTALIAELRARGCGSIMALRRQHCDLLDRSAALRFFGEYRPTLVFHLAAWVAGVQGNMDNAGRAFYENALINLNVIEATRLCGARKIIAAGTTATYSDEVSLPMREADIWQGRPHGSEEAYGHAKRAMLAQLEAYRKQYGLNYAYMVCSNLYGENDRFDERCGHVVPALISRFERATRERADSIVIWGDGSPTRDFVYARDAARAFAAAADPAAQGAYNLATGESVSIRQLVDTLAAVFGFDGRVEWDTSRPNGQMRRAYDVSRIRGDLGWAPEVPLGEGLGRTARWFRDRGDDARR